ncbi:hypothetical protein U0070_003053, partial [Myodes glareolus]
VWEKGGFEDGGNGIKNRYEDNVAQLQDHILVEFIIIADWKDDLVQSLQLFNIVWCHIPQFDPATFHLPRLLRPSVQQRPMPSSSPGALRALHSGHSTPQAGLSAEGKGAEGLRRPRKPSRAPKLQGDVGRSAAALLPMLRHTYTRDTGLLPAAASSQTPRRASKMAATTKKMATEDVNVTFEDQQKINKFARNTSRITELKEEI